MPNKDSVNAPIKAELARTVKGLERDLSVLDDIRKTMSKLNDKIFSIHESEGKNLEGFFERVVRDVGDRPALVKEIKKMQDVLANVNHQYLQLQTKMQDESRRFTLVSNVMKTKHDTVKNSISNIR